MRHLAIVIGLFLCIEMSAQTSSTSKFLAFRLQPHEDLRQGTMRFARENGLKAASIVACVGSLEKTSLRFANQNEATVRQGHFEIVSLTGTVDKDYCHLHLAVADSTGTTFGGHLLDGSLVYTTAEIVMVELTELEFKREVDRTYGYKELTIRKRDDH